GAPRSVLRERAPPVGDRVDGRGKVTAAAEVVARNGGVRMTSGRLDARVWAALGVVYVVWGSTYLAIRFAIETLPPLVSAGLRFVAAGLLMLALVWVLRGRAALRATPAQLGTASASGILLLLGGNGLVSIGEQRVAS